VIEGLAGLVRQVTKLHVLQGVKVGSNDIEINLLQFSDDTLFICENTVQNVMTIKCILRCFELVFGLKVNFLKVNLERQG